MKRASLKVVPAASLQEPTDLTDRLLDREAERTPPPAGGKRAARPAQPPPAPAKAAAPAIEPEPSPLVVAAAPAPTKATPEPAPASLAGALEQAQAASHALEAATQEAPARYSVALRYRLEALAQHLRQVSDFVRQLSAKEK